MVINTHIITTQINEKLVDSMIVYAKSYAPSVNINIINITKVPGTLEMPFCANEILLNKTKIDALLIFGVVIKGKTKHGEVIAHQTTKALLDLQIQYRTPMSIAIIGPCSTIEHATKKAKKTIEKAMRAIQSLIKFRGV